MIIIVPLIIKLCSKKSKDKFQWQVLGSISALIMKQQEPLDNMIYHLDEAE